jgi:hypothetical protein
VPSFYQWKRRLRGVDTTEATGLVPVRPLSATPREVAVPIQIVTPDGFVLDQLLPDRWLQQHPTHRWTIECIRREERRRKEKARRRNRHRRRKSTG